MKTILLTTLTIMVAVLYSCGGSGADTQNYQDPALMHYKINKIAVLPIRNSYLGLNESREVNRYFMTGVARKIFRGVSFGA